MSILHICNTFFEWELAGKTPSTLEAAFGMNAITLQLQFLPLVYAEPEDPIVVTSFPHQEISHPLVLLSDQPSGKIDSWGYSQLIQKWASKRNIPYPMPPWDVVKMVNSKAFSFARSPLPGAKLIYAGDPIPPGMALKNCFGTAGRGIIQSDTPKAKAFCEEEWKLGLPVIAEPWMKRNLDFSTQWVISNSGEIAYIGATLCKTTPNGIHQSNTAGMEDPPYIEQQKAVAMEVLQEIADMGYFGPIGIDAMVYNGSELQPIVEINARKTMGLITLLVQQKQYPGKVIELGFFESKQTEPLPQSLDGRSFSRQVIISVK